MPQLKLRSDIQKFIESNHFSRKTGNTILLDSDESFLIRKVQTKNDFKKVFDVRWKTYKRFFNKEDDLIDLNDFTPNVTLLLAEDEQNNPVGTIRILDRRSGRIELDQFIEINSLLSRSDMPCAEATRFSIPKHPKSAAIRFLLYKAFLLYCQNKGINTMLISVRRITSRNYRFFYFKHLGPAGIYNHPLMGNLEYHTYKCNISETCKFLKVINFQLYQFFCVKEHLNINIT